MIESLEECRAQGHAVEPVALFQAEVPGFMCKECGGWSSIRRSDFRRAFGKTFGVFRRDDLGVRRESVGVVKVTRMACSIFLRGRRAGVSGCSADRRKRLRAAEREEAADA